MSKRHRRKHAVRAKSNRQWSRINRLFDRNLAIAAVLAETFRAISEEGNRKVTA